MFFSIAKELENGKLLSRIVIAEARRVKAINEDGVDAEAQILAPPLPPKQI